MTKSMASLRDLQLRMSESLGTSSLLQAAVENASEAFLITTADIEWPEIEYVNHAFEKMTGYTADEMIGQRPSILQGPKTNRDVLDRLKSTLKEGKPFFGRTVNYRKDGTEYLLEWHISPVKGNDGQVEHYVSIQRSLTDLPLVTQEELDELLK